ncbi:MAG TPA: sterol desaturase family protein [Nitrospiraceae bacterium]|nr:sterol desaturase family protein [Nitrospiraceae bacterium]
MNQQINKFFKFHMRALLILGTFALLFCLERRRPLRRTVDSSVQRTGRNLAMAGLAAVALRVGEQPVARTLTTLVERRRWGLLRMAGLPQWIETAMAILLLDYTLYVWHVLIHRVPWLWRMHVVHHVDLDLDASTAVRFHVTELLVSILWRSGQILCIGVRQHTLSLWQTLTLLSVLFHHSNVRLPLTLERVLVHFIVTPRMHGIHHSIVKAETNSNWSSGLTIWDRLHRTLRLDVPQSAITIGVPAYRAQEEITLRHLPIDAVRAAAANMALGVA